MAAIAKGMLAALAPILPHLAEDAWQSLPSNYTAPHSSVFLAGWPVADSAWKSLPEENVATAVALKSIRDHVNIVSSHSQLFVVNVMNFYFYRLVQLCSRRQFVHHQ